MRCVLLAAIAAMAAPACSSGADPGKDAGPGGDAVADTTDAVVAACDLAAQNCATGSKCDFGCQGTATAVLCQADNGSAAIGSACSAAMPCAKGAGCLTMSTTGSLCLKYCAGDGDCAT